MRALPFFILALIGLVLQVAVGPAVELSAAHAQPQFLLILALFVALFARPDAALLGCWTLGLMLDLATIGPLGGFAFAFGLVGLGVVRVRSSIFRDHAVSHVFLALVFCFLANEVVALRVAISTGFNSRLLLSQPLGTALYTAVLAPCLMPLLNSMRRVMQLPERGP